MTSVDDEGYWVTHSCFFACGGRCVNRSYVKNGKVICQASDTLHADSPDYPQQRGCARGRSLRHAIFSKDRLKYPLKRKHWAVGGGRKDLRGIDEWERISWDEALDIVASEVTRIKNKYGNKSILATGYEYRNVIPGLYTAPSLNAYGGCCVTWGQASQGAFPLVANSMKGSYTLGAQDFSDRYAIRKAKLILMWGQNPAWSQAGNSLYHYLQGKQNGARFVFIDSWFNPSMQVLADQWIAVRPGTDTALLLALAYYMIKHNLQDQDFLDRHCIGFDASHMPIEADPKDNFKDYVLGTYDGLPKSPSWAESICGVPENTIEELAYEMATTKPLTMRSSQAPARTDNGATFVQAFYTVGWMTGNVGFPGAEVSAGGSAGNMVFGGDPLIKPGPKGCSWPENPVCQPPRGGGMLAKGSYDPDAFYGIAMSEVWDSVVNGYYSDFIYGRKPIDIRMIWKIGDGARMNQNPNFKQAEKAYRSVEFAVASDLWMTNDCKYSDIVLPASSFWERDAQVLTQINRETFVFAQKVVDPPGEAKEDLWIEKELAKRWGIDPKIVQPLSTKQMAFNELLGAEVILPDGSGYEYLVSVTEDDLIQLGVEGKAHSGRIPIKEFLKTGVYQVPRSEKDPFGFVAYEDFRQNPEENPVDTPSGKFEIYCSALPQKFKNFGLTEIAPIAHYVPARDGYECSFDPNITTESQKNIKAVQVEYYSLQCISVHSPNRSHQLFGNVAQLLELFPHDIWINPLDAQQRQIDNASTVLVSSRYGQILRRAKVSRLVMQGVVVLGQGAWSSVNSQGIDIGGNANTLQGSQLTGEGHCTWNTSLVNIEPWNGDPLPFDYERFNEDEDVQLHSVMASSQTTIEFCTEQVGFYFNSNECSGCKTCVAACKDIHNLPSGMTLRKVISGEGGSWSRNGNVLKSEGVFSLSLSIACNHCDNPVCIEVCPRGAISKDKTSGIVTINEELCIGCGKCAKKCPYHAPVVDKSIRRAYKCDLCISKLNMGEEPACVTACPMRCLKVGSVSELLQSNSQIANLEESRVAINRLYNSLVSPDSDESLLLDETKPNIIFVPHRNIINNNEIQLHLSSMPEEL